jgi:hypothetical protein
MKIAILRFSLTVKVRQLSIGDMEGPPGAIVETAGMMVVVMLPQELE